jgi:hypothetical protein
MKSALPGYDELRARLQSALGPDRLPLLIGVDGPTGWGKSSTASWLGWQFGMPAVHLDFYTDLATRELTTGAAEVDRLIDYRIAASRPVIVEGILETIGRQPDFLVYVDGDDPDAGSKYGDRIRDYQARYDPRSRADFILRGYDEVAEALKHVHDL